MSAAPRGRTIVFGVDSADLLLIERWAGEGLLPFFDSMLRHGPLVRLTAVSRVLQGAVWTSLLTGRSPGEHGTFYFTQLTNGTYNLDQVETDHYALDPYYSQLEAHGVHCAIVDVPGDMPIEGFKGVHVVDWLTEFQYWRFATQPAAVKQQIEAELGVLSPSGGFGPTLDGLEGHRQLRARLEQTVTMKAALARQLLARADLSHVFLVFAEAHKAGHFLWKYMDAAHPEHVAAEPYLRDALLEIYQLLDRTLAELAAELHPEDNLLIFSDHGMQANYRGDHLVGAILDRLQLQAPRQARDAHEKADSVPARALPKHGARARLRALVRRTTPNFFLRALRHRFGEASRMDWSRTKVFLLPTDRNTYLRVNLRGREPAGIVAPGKEYDELLAFLAREFRALVNVETGKPAVEAVYHVHELFPGPRAADLPDITVVWAADAPLNSVESARLGRIDVRVREDRSGNHRSEGFLLARGPAFRPGPMTLHGDVMQFPATMLALHGVERPAYYAMPPLTEALTASQRARSTADASRQSRDVCHSD